MKLFSVAAWGKYCCRYFIAQNTIDENKNWMFIPSKVEKAFVFLKKDADMENKICKYLCFPHQQLQNI